MLPSPTRRCEPEWVPVRADTGLASRILLALVLGMGSTVLIACPAVDGPGGPGPDAPQDDDDWIRDGAWGVDPDIAIEGDDDDSQDPDLTEDDLAIDVESPQTDGLDSAARFRVTWSELRRGSGGRGTRPALV
jgi:hypothetical protein